MAINAIRSIIVVPTHEVLTKANRKRHDLVLLEQRAEFKNLDLTVQSLVIGLAAGQKSLDELAELTRQSTLSIRQHMTEELNQHQMMADEKNYCEKFLDSLYFPEIHSREGTIAEAHKKTFQWIFDETGQAVQPWSNFIRWLETGGETYWINGKAGSGKSTLMNYILEDPRTIAALERWSGARELLTPSFFFWNAGSDMQKCSLGLLRSLLHQLLDSFPHLILPLARGEKSRHTSRVSPHRLPPLAAWNERRLIEMLENLLRNGLSSCRLCLFIDGLDEIEGDQDGLVVLIQNLAVTNPDVKICLSSRPEPSFTYAFSSSATLRLQDLTRKDIEVFVCNRLQAVPRQRLLVLSEPDWVSSIKDTIIEKAQGVFLWVTLAVKLQIKGLDNDDSLEQLQERLWLLPNELDGLYTHMLKKIEIPYKEEAAAYLQAVLEADEAIALSDIAFMFYEKTHEILSASSTLSINDMVLKCNLTRKRLNVICAGFLEVSDNYDYFPKSHLDPKNTEVNLLPRGNWSFRDRRDMLRPAEALYHDSYRTKTDFIHRTAHDFLQQNALGRDFLNKSKYSRHSIRGLYVRALLAKLLIFPPNEASRRSSPTVKWMAYLPLRDSSFPSHSFSRTMKYEIRTIIAAARTAELGTGLADMASSESIDPVITLVDQQYENQHPGSHWCTRWNLTDPIKDYNCEASLSPCDFLSFAASRGLHCYVLEILKAKRGSDDQDGQTRLLWNAAWSSWGTTAKLDLTSALLKRGANPNVGTTTHPDNGLHGLDFWNNCAVCGASRMAH